MRPFFANYWCAKNVQLHMITLLATKRNSHTDLEGVAFLGRCLAVFLNQVQFPVDTCYVA